MCLVPIQVTFDVGVWARVLDSDTWYQSRVALGAGLFLVLLQVLALTSRGARLTPGGTV